MKAIILMAGIGKRLGRSLPKCLTELPNGETILDRQLRFLRSFVDEIIAVVGFKKEIIMEVQPDILYVYNQNFTQNNTAKSLLKAFEAIGEDDVIWLNGDVVFKEVVLKKIFEGPKNSVAVEFKKCGKEEIKFLLDDEGNIVKISKEIDIDTALGEAVGINKLSKEGFEIFKDSLRKCSENDYFEKAIELSYEKLKFKPVDVGTGNCVEVDFIDDLKNAWDIINDSEDESSN
ncbi:MAG: hypothetical protein PWQ20_1139 [Thermotogaceae bacterium]|nr:hypothetical protein [Thermotogaceae bacterium]